MLVSDALNRQDKGSLFANYKEFLKAAAFANEHWLGQPYLNGLNSFRWINQRSIVLLDDGRVLTVPDNNSPKDVIGIKEARGLAIINEDNKQQLIKQAAQNNEVLKRIIEDYGKRYCKSKGMPWNEQQVKPWVDQKFEAIKKLSPEEKNKEIEKLIETKLVTLDEIVQEYNKNVNVKNKNKRPEEQKPLIAKGDVGKVNIAHIEKRTDKKIVKVVHRPNHDMMHSVRVSAYIPLIHDLFNNGKVEKDGVGLIKNSSKLDDKHIEKLQLMMLFSVLGREDETGFSDSQKGTSLYQSYRASDGLDFLSYCLKNWDTHYKDVFNNDKDELYRAALTVELMGYPEMPEIEKVDPTPVMSVIMKGYSNANFKHLKDLIQYLPNNNILRAFTEDQLKALFPQNPVQYLGPSSNVDLTYMNAAHGMDLMRCYEPGDHRKAKQQGASYFGNIEYFYTQICNKYISNNQWGSKSMAQELIEHLVVNRRILDTFGGKTFTNVKLDSTTVQDTIESATAIEAFIINKSSHQVPYTDCKNELIEIKSNGVMQKISFEQVVNQLQLEDSLLGSAGLKDGQTIDYKALLVVIPRFSAAQLVYKGSFAVQPKRFDFCHYKGAQELDEPLDLNNPEHRDYRQDIQCAMMAIDNVPRPTHALDTKFQASQDEFYQRIKELIWRQCKDGIAVIRQANNLYIEFSDNTIALEVSNSLVHLGLLEKMPSLKTSPLGDGSILAEISESNFKAIEPYVKYRLAKIPKTVSLDDNLISPNGMLTPLDIIQGANASVCVHNGRKPQIANATQTGLEYYFNQLDDPIHNRPVKIEQLKDEDRKIIYDQRNADDSTGKKKQIRRQLIQTVSLENQSPVLRNRPLEDYWIDEKTQKPVAVFQERGQPKNTVYTKKNSQTLLLPNGKQRLFQGTFSSNGSGSYFTDFQVGVLFDVRECHTYGERYMWHTNVVSNNKFWIENTGNIEDKQKNKKIAVSLKQLQKNISDAAQRQEREPNSDIASWNEMLIGTSKQAVKALFCPGDSNTKDTATLSLRLNLINQSLALRDQFGMDVPLLVIDGTHPPVRYSEDMLVSDMLHAYTAILDGSYPYMDLTSSSSDTYYKLTCEEQKLILDFFQTMTGNVCTDALRDYPVPAKYTNRIPEYNLFVKDIIDSNNSILKKYLNSLQLNEQNIRQLVENKRMLGGKLREAERIDVAMKSPLETDNHQLRSLLVRNLVLGHQENVKNLFELSKNKGLNISLDSPLTPNNDTALHLAVVNGHVNLVKYLVSEGANVDIKNQEGNTVDNIINVLKNKNTDNDSQALYKNLMDALIKQSVSAQAQLQPHQAGDMVLPQYSKEYKAFRDLDGNKEKVKNYFVSPAYLGMSIQFDVVKLKGLLYEAIAHNDHETFNQLMDAYVQYNKKCNIHYTSFNDIASLDRPLQQENILLYAARVNPTFVDRLLELKESNSINFTRQAVDKTTGENILHLFAINGDMNSYLRLQKSVIEEYSYSQATFQKLGYSLMGNQMDHSGNTPLHYLAINNGKNQDQKNEVLKNLLSQPVILNYLYGSKETLLKSNNHGFSPIMIAALQQNTELVETMLEHLDLDGYEKEIYRWITNDPSNWEAILKNIDDYRIPQGFNCDDFQITPDYIDNHQKLDLKQNIAKPPSLLTTKQQLKTVLSTANPNFDTVKRDYENLRYIMTPAGAENYINQILQEQVEAQNPNTILVSNIVDLMNKAKIPCKAGIPLLDFALNYKLDSQCVTNILKNSSDGNILLRKNAQGMNPLQLAHEIDITENSVNKQGYFELLLGIGNDNFSKIGGSVAVRKALEAVDRQGDTVIHKLIKENRIDELMRINTDHGKQYWSFFGNPHPGIYRKASTTMNISNSDGMTPIMLMMNQNDNMFTFILQAYHVSNDNKKLYWDIKNCFEAGKDPNTDPSTQDAVKKLVGHGYNAKTDILKYFKSVNKTVSIKNK